MPANDCFNEIARYYDGLMRHVDYTRWYATVSTVADIIPQPFLHIDLACGTCKVIKKLRSIGWNSLGLDLSFPMLRTGRKEAPETPTAVADMRNVPLPQCADYVTCLFDSINFLPSMDDIARTFREVYRVLKDGGLFYFDIVTERMVTEHFAGQSWTERHGRMTTTWESEYDPRTRLSETRVRVSTGPEAVICEYMYDPADVEQAARDAGFTLFGIHDAETWKRPRKKKTIRMDFVAAKNPSRACVKAFKGVQREIRGMLV
jgi:SAM-dependent methyltransferase